MSTIASNRTSTSSYFSAGIGKSTAPLDPAASPLPQSAVAETETAPGTGALRQRGGQLVQARVELPSVRNKRALASKGSEGLSETKRKRPAFPAPADAKKADESLQKALTHSLTNILPFYDPIPEDASIKPFIDAFSKAVRDPKVQAWLKSRKFDLSTVRVLSDRVEGIVNVDGKTQTQRFTTVDGSGWREVSAKVCAAVRRLSTDADGVFLPDVRRGFIHVNTLLGFYGVKPPSLPKDRQQLGIQLEKEGWPAITDEQRVSWSKQYKQLVRENSDLDTRSQVASQLQALVNNKAAQSTLNLKGEFVDVKPTSSLARSSRGPRARFAEWLAAPAFKTFIEKTGFGGTDNLYRISDGNLERRDSGNRWIILQGLLADEINKVQLGGSLDEQTAIETLSTQFDQLVASSNATGNALYSQPLYDARQFLAFSKLGTPTTVAQVNSAIAQLSNTPPGKDEMSSVADRTLQLFLSGSTLRNALDKNVELPADTTIFKLFSAYRDAFDTNELKGWLQEKNMESSTVVIKGNSVTGRVTHDGVSKMQTFNTSDSSGWRQVSAKLRVAARGLDPDAKGLPYVDRNSNSFSRNAILRWYGVKPPASDGDVMKVQKTLAKVDWSALPPSKKAALERQVKHARDAIDTLDQRADLAKTLTSLLANKGDDEAVSLTGVQVRATGAPMPAGNDAKTVPVVEALQAFGFPEPRTVKQVRNVARWLAPLEPAAPWGNYSGLLVNKWLPGYMSAADKTFLAGLSDEDASRKRGDNILRELDVGGMLDRATPEQLRNQSDHFLKLLVGSSAALKWGEEIAQRRKYLGASGTAQMTSNERAQWVIAAIKLQIDPGAPGRPGTVAGYELYKPGDSGKTMAELRADIENHLKLNPRIDPKTAPLIAHLFLASAAPEFLIPDTPTTLRVGSSEWSDLRQGVVIAERLGGQGSTRSMNYNEIIALSRLDGRTTEEEALFTSYGADTLLDWGMMRGLYAKSLDGQYKSGDFQEALKGFNAEHEQLLNAFDVFNLPLPTREKLALENLKKEFPDISEEQLKTINVFIANPNERRNMKLSEPRMRSLLETYMSGDLKPNRWMLLPPDKQVPKLQTPRTPYGPSPHLSQTDQADVNQNVASLNAKIAKLPDLKTQVPPEVDSYLGKLKQGLGATTRLMITNLPLADRQALELGNVELFALREEVTNVPLRDQTTMQIDARRGRKGTLIRSEHKGLIRYYEVFPDKMKIVRRKDLPDNLSLGGTIEKSEKYYAYLNTGPTPIQLEHGAVQPFDFNAYNSSAQPRPGVSSPGIIIDKLGDTLEAAPDAEKTRADVVPNSFSSARTQAIVDRIMQSNFIHHRDDMLKFAIGQLPLEEQRELARENDKVLLGMIPFVGAIVDLANGNTFDGIKALFLDSLGAVIGGAGSSVKALIKSTKAVAPFGAKAFNVMEKGVQLVSSFLNPLDGAADMTIAAGRGVAAIPKLANNAAKLSPGSFLLGVEEKARAAFSLRNVKNSGRVFKRTKVEQEDKDSETVTGKVGSKPIDAVKVGQSWYATNPENGLPIGTPLEGFVPLRAASA